MSDPVDWNAQTIAEFRANEGRVGGTFEGAPMVLVHHRGRTSGHRVYADQARRSPGFAEYERLTEGVRTIPVLELTRA